MKNIILSALLVSTMFASAQVGTDSFKEFIGHWKITTMSDITTQLVIYQDAYGAMQVTEMLIDHEGGLNRGVLMATTYTYKSSNGTLEVETINPSTLEITQYTLSIPEKGKILKTNSTGSTDFSRY